jgi:hypothetical protein
MAVGVLPSSGRRGSGDAVLVAVHVKNGSHAALGPSHGAFQALRLAALLADARGRGAAVVVTIGHASALQAWTREVVGGVWPGGPAAPRSVEQVGSAHVFGGERVAVGACVWGGCTCAVYFPKRSVCGVWGVCVLVACMAHPHGNMCGAPFVCPGRSPRCVLSHSGRCRA